MSAAERAELSDFLKMYFPFLSKNSLAAASSAMEICSPGL
jgi:hypothetical protein